MPIDPFAALNAMLRAEAARFSPPPPAPAVPSASSPSSSQTQTQTQKEADPEPVVPPLKDRAFGPSGRARRPEGGPVPHEAH